jgi:hypothetical protein
MSEIRAATVSNLAGTGPVTLTKQSAAKAWITYASNVTPLVVYDSFNVSGVTDNGSGNQTINFSSAFAVGDNISAVSSTNWRGIACPDGYATTAVDVLTADNNGTSTSDRGRVGVALLGDLA